MPALGAVELLALGAEGAAGLLGAGTEKQKTTWRLFLLEVSSHLCSGLSGLPVVLALTVSEAGLVLAVPFTAASLVPFVTAAGSDAVLLGPTGFFSGTFLWLLPAVETVATPVGLLGTAPAAEEDFAAVGVFFAETLLCDLTSLTPR